MRIGETKMEMIKIIQGLCTKNIRTFCWPSRAKMLVLLKKHYNKTITESALDKHFADLHRIGFMASYQRKGQKDDGTWYNKVSNRQLTRKCIFYLLKHGHRIAQWLINWAKKGILPKAERKSCNINKVHDNNNNQSKTLSKDLDNWLKTPSLKLKHEKQPG